MKDDLSAVPDVTSFLHSMSRYHYDCKNVDTIMV
jgi:hypothetical protein